MSAWDKIKQYVKDSFDVDKQIEKSKKTEKLARQKSRQYRAQKNELDAKKALQPVDMSGFMFGDPLGGKNGKNVK